MAAGKSGDKGVGLVRLSISVPRGALDLLQDLFRFGGVDATPKSFIEHEVLQSVDALLDELNIDSEVLDVGKIRERYKLPEQDEDP